MISGTIMSSDFRKSFDSIEKGSIVVLESMKGEAVAIAESNISATKIASLEYGEVARPKVVLMPSGTYPQTWSKE